MNIKLILIELLVSLAATINFTKCIFLNNNLSILLSVKKSIFYDFVALMQEQKGKATN
jgi:hypothetical protein